jgi:undecaprenol kinase
MKNQPYYVRLGYAVAGIKAVWRRESSFRIECAFAIAAILIMVVIQPGWLWAAIIALSIGLVFALELVNSSLEYLIDHVHPDFAEAIGLAKDAAAGAVLLASLGALAAGLMMLTATIKF